MLHTIFYYCYLGSVYFGNFFLISAIVGFIRYKDFYIKLHAVSMFNIYGINLILFAMAINSYNPVIFFEVLLVMITNTLCTLCAIHCFIRNAILNGVKYKAKTREDVIKEKTIKLKEEMMDEEFIKIKKEEIKKEKERRKQEKIAEKERKKQEKIAEKEKKKLEKETKNKKEEKSIETNNIAETQNQQKTKNINDATANNSISNNTTAAKTTPSPTQIQQKTPAVDDDEDLTEEEKKIKKENEELRAKIKEQKKILRKKIETARKKAFITRKPEEIEKTEKMIKDILTKHNLTEEMLKDDDDE